MLAFHFQYHSRVISIGINTQQYRFIFITPIIR